MGIDLATWRSRIGLNYYCYCRRSLPVQGRIEAARLGEGDVVNSTPLFQGCMRDGCGKVCCPKMEGNSTHSGDARRAVGVGCGVALLLQVCMVVLVLLLIAGDVERNPGPTGKAGSDQLDKLLPSVDNSSLGEKDLFDILAEMVLVVGRWKAIGRGFRIDSGHLEKIQADNHGDCEECLSGVLTYWLRKNYDVELFGEPTWRTVVQVVAHSAAGNNCAVALRIAEKHSVVTCTAPQESIQTASRSQESCVSNMVSDEGVSVSSRLSSSTQTEEFQKPPFEWIAATHQTSKKMPLKSREDLFGSSIVSDDVFTSEDASVSPRPSSSTQIEGSQKPPFGCGCGKCTFLSFIESGCPNPNPVDRKFPYLDTSGLTTEQQQVLEDRLLGESREIMFKLEHVKSVVMKSLVRRGVTVDGLLSHLTILESIDPVKKQPISPNCYTDLMNAKTIPQVFIALTNYFSFFNYDIIDHITNELGTEEDKQELQKYKDDFQLYAKRRIYECLPQFGPVSEMGNANIFVKVDSHYESYTVRELRGFKNRLSGIFRISSQGVLRLCWVEEGCFQLMFQVRSFLQQEIFPLSSGQEKALVAEGVIRLTCGSYDFVVKGENESEPESTAQRSIVEQDVQQPTQTCIQSSKKENIDILGPLLAQDILTQQPGHPKPSQSPTQQPSPYGHSQAASSPSGIDYSLKVEPSKPVRRYQLELAQPGIRGENYIICAPTGTGKTLVAGLIISCHLQRRQDLKKKVVFVVPTRPLAEQQYEELQRLQIEHLISLCALMDAKSGIRTVRENVNELDQFTNKPTFTLKILSRRNPRERFIQHIADEMIRLEKLVDLKSPFDKWSQEYETSVQQKRQPLEIGLNPDFRNDIRTLDLLSCYSRALKVYMDLQNKDAISILSEFTGLPDDDKANQSEKQLKQSLGKLIDKLRQLPPVQNPILQQVKDILHNQFTTNPDSKGILFVHTKKHASSMCNWMSAPPIATSLDIRPCTITGHTREARHGMTQAEQEEVMESFRKGECNLLVATSVAEEGLDVPACNLVIRFQHVSNEIASIQSQGRARAAESEGFTILSSDSKKEYKEIINDEVQAHIDMVLQTYFPTGRSLQEKLSERQEKIVRECQLRSLRQQQKKTETRDDVQLLCKKCKEFACYGSDVYTVENASHFRIVPDENFKAHKIVKKPYRHAEQITPLISKTHKIYCTNCDANWGSMCVWPMGEFPVLKCMHFIFKIRGVPHSIQKWSDVPFEIPPFTPCHVESNDSESG